MKSVMKHQFSQVPRVSIPRSTFDRSHGHKTTFDAGYLIPVFADEALPGDTFNLSMTAFSRMSTPIFPVMDNLYMDSFFFAVPLRLIWDNFQRFMGEQTDPGDSTDYLIPTMESPASTGYEPGTLSDYLGIPSGVPELEHTSLFHRAYNLIYNEWFRDQNLQDSVTVDKDDGPDDDTDYEILRRGKRHDYFTSALPWPQKGEAVVLPMGESAPIAVDQNPGGNIGIFSVSQDAYHEMDSDQAKVDVSAGVVTAATSMYADLTDATTVTINQLRQSFQIQKLLERDARGGTRYTEIVKSHFGVTSPDSRLQRPEYLGGGSTPININPVVATATSVFPVTPYQTMSRVGETGAYSTTAIKSNGFTKSFTEHCVIIGMVSVRADLTYQQGLNKMFSRSTRYDMYWPSLAHIGEQSILNKEIYAQGAGNPSEDEEVFGYQERYAEYRYKPSIISGEFRSSVSGSLDAWHLSQEFGSLPTLGATFIEETPPMDRILAVDSEPDFIFDSYFRMKCARPMPVYGVPGMIDHF